MAYQGKLSEQKATDGDVALIYSDIREFVANKDLPEVDSTECFTEIPSNWKWVRIGNIAKINPKNEKDDDEDASFIPMALVTEGFQNKHSFEIKKWGDIKKGFNHFCEGDIGVAKITPCFQNRKSVIFRNLCNGFGACTTELVILRTLEDLLLGEYLLYFFKTEYFILKGMESFTGVVGQQRIHKDYLKMSPIPLPPVEEQRRIVQKIKESFELLDIIDDMQSQYSSDLEILKSKIIDAGIQGKLTEQFPEDGTAEELLEQIRSKKDRMINEGLIPKESVSKKIGNEDMNFEIPQNWGYARVQDVATYITDYVANGSFATLKANTKTYKEPNYAVFVRTLDLGAQFCNELSYIDEASYEFLRKSKLYGGELILPNIGASIGKAFIMPDLGMPMSLAPNSVMVKFENNIMNKYFYYVFQSSYGKGILMNIQGGAATPKFSKTDLRKMIVMLPPLAEQERIVNRIEEIFALIQ